MIACAVSADTKIRVSSKRPPTDFQMSSLPPLPHSLPSLSSSSSSSSLSSSSSSTCDSPPRTSAKANIDLPLGKCDNAAPTLSSHKRKQQEYQQLRRNQRRASSQVVHHDALAARIAPYREALGAANYRVINCIHIPSSLTRLRHKRRGASVDNFEVRHRGDHGVLFQAVSDPDGRLHAVRVVDKHEAPHAYEVMVREARFLELLRHRNVVHFHDASAHGKFGLFATEYCPKGSAFDVVSRTTDGLCESEALSLVSGALRALRLAHSRGIAHRAITMRAILVSASGTPRLASFYAAVQLRSSDSNHNGSHIPSTHDSSLSSGTAPCNGGVDGHSDVNAGSWQEASIENVEYAPPEALLGGTFVSPAEADMWAMGIVLYALLSKAVRFGNSAWLRVTPHGVVADIGPLLTDPRVASTSRACRSLLAGLLTINPKHRLSAHDALVLCNTALVAAPKRA